MNNALYKRRLLINKFNLTMAWATMAFGLFWLAWILFTLFGQGIDQRQNVGFCAVLRFFMQSDGKEPHKTGKTDKNESTTFL